MAFSKGFQEGVNLWFVALGFEFDPAIDQVPDVAGNVKTCSQLFGGKAKTHALHPAFVENLFGNHGLILTCGCVLVVERRATEGGNEEASVPLQALRMSAGGPPKVVRRLRVETVRRAHF